MYANQKKTGRNKEKEPLHIVYELRSLGQLKIYTVTVLS
jgi:hypothetical protein